MASCARNPVTGKNELSLVSEGQEIQMGQQAAQEVAQTIGFVDDSELQSYVANIGKRMAAKSERPDLPWEFHVVNDASVNAFALPGGFIYVTRGLLGSMNSEAELATVLGHEIGHVTARHSVQQISKAQLATLGLGIGSIVSSDIAQFAGLASQGLQVLFLKYGRDAENQADEPRLPLCAHPELRRAGDGQRLRDPQPGEPGGGRRGPAPRVALDSPGSGEPGEADGGAPRHAARLADQRDREPGRST